MEAAQVVEQGLKLTSLDRLRMAARRQFVEEGYDKTRPQDIAREAGLANGTFYIHFHDKKAAFLDFAENAQSELIGEFTRQLEGVVGREQRWYVIFSVMEHFSQQNPGLLEAAFMDPLMIAPQDADAWRLYDRIGRFVMEALKERSEKLSTDYDLEMVSHAICGMVRHAMIFAARKGMDKEKMISDLISLIDKGLYR